MDEGKITSEHAQEVMEKIEIDLQNSKSGITFVIPKRENAIKMYGVNIEALLALRWDMIKRAYRLLKKKETRDMYDGGAPNEQGFCISKAGGRPTERRIL